MPSVSTTPSRAVAPGIQRIVDSRGDVSFKVQIRRNGHPSETKRFAALADAKRWQRARQSEIDLGQYVDRREAAKSTVGQLMQRYGLEVTPTKRSARVEAGRLRVLARDPLAKINAAQLQPHHIHAYITSRHNAGVSGSTINRELNLLSHIFSKARKAWGLPISNPVADVERPRESPPRDRRISAAEIDAICAASFSVELPTVLRLAVTTGMRRGEMLGLRWEDLDLTARIARLHVTKNGEGRRVPLSLTAVGLLEARRPAQPEDAPADWRPTGPVFKTSDPHSFSTGMRRTIKRARERYVRDCAARGVRPEPSFLVGVHLHDARHEAVSRLVEAGVDQMTTAKIVGHKTLAMTMRYFTARDAHMLAAVDAADVSVNP